MDHPTALGSLKSTLASFFEATLTPSPAVFLIGFLIVLLAPVLLHHLLTRTTPYASLPSVLLIGPSGAGKTALLTLLERGPLSKSASDAHPAQTHTSQIPASVELAVSDNPSTSYTVDLDAAGATAKKFLLLDTPGHGKLRAPTLARVGHKDDKSLRAVVFLLDAADLDTLSTDAAEYLYDALLSLQKRAGSSKSSKSPRAIPVLVAANKADLFTALPAALVKARLETELGRIRKTRSRGLLGASVKDESEAGEEGDDWLGEYGSEKFGFGQMREFDVEVEVVGGNVTGEGPGVQRWWRWIAEKI